MEQFIRTRPSPAGLFERVLSAESEASDTEELINVLMDTLMIDPLSIKQICATRGGEGKTNLEDEELHIDYEEVDFEALKRHPRISQYGGIRGTWTHVEHSDIYMLLEVMSSQFKEFITGHAPGGLITGLEVIDVDPQPGEELDEKEKEQREIRQISEKEKERKRFKRFVQRFLQGIRNRDFQVHMGHTVVDKNYLFLSYFLVHLLMREKADNDFVLASLVNLWEFFWGGDEGGYYYQRGASEKEQFLDLFNKFLGPVLTLVSLFLCGFIARTWELDDERSSLRDIARALFAKPPFSFGAGVLEAASSAASQMQLDSEMSSAAVIAELLSLAGFETDKEFCRRIESEHAFQKDSCRFTIDKGIMMPFEGKIIKGKSRTLLIRFEDMKPDKQTLVQILQKVMRKEKLPYYRIRITDNRGTFALLTYEGADSRLVYIQEDIEKPDQEYVVLRPLLEPWDRSIMSLELAERTAL